MTIEEKSNAIEAYCIGRDNYDNPCDSCPLYAVVKDTGENCFSMTGNNADIDRNYAVLFGGPDSVNHPVHYETGKFECIDVMVETQGARNVQAFCICNAFKYLYRHKRKNGLEDVKKAIWYLNKFVELEEGASNDPA